MALSSNPRRLKRSLWAIALASLVSLPVFGQSAISLAQLGARKLPNHAPAHAGEKVVVRGVVSAPAFRFPGYTLLAIQDSAAGGALQAGRGDRRLDALTPGDEVQAEGIVENLAGMPVVHIKSVATIGRSAPPKPISVSVSELLNFPANLQYLGRLVRTEARVLETSPTTAGGQILVGSESELYKLFIPTNAQQPNLSNFETGDRVAVTGVALQFCPVPPHNGFFELLVNDAGLVQVTARARTFPPVALALALSVVLFVSFFLWSRERRLRSQRERLRGTYQLAEEILSSPSAGAILERVSEVLPRLLGVTGVRLYVHNRTAGTLESATGENAEPVSIPLSSSPSGTQAGAVACFHYRTLLVIPDTTRSPFPMTGEPGECAPKSMLLVPMLAQSEVMGVLELDQDNRFRDFKPDEQAIAQHLGNQIGVAIRLLEQRSVQEQLFRTEKLAAVGKLISGVIDELQTPLASISELAEKGLEKGQAGPAGRELAAIVSETRKATGMVERLVTFGRGETTGAHPVCIPALLRRLIQFREQEWRASGIKVEDLTTQETLSVLGSEGQLEQVFLNLMVHAEQCLAGAPRKTVTIRTGVLAGRLLIEISFTAPLTSGKSKMENTASVLGLARGVIAGHGGEVRLLLKNDQDPRFEVELPVAPKEHAPAASLPAQLRDSSRPVTVLVIEPDELAQKQILALLAARGCRVVPVGNADVGLELCQRMRFDAAFCSVHAPGLNWVELSERMRARVGAFILISDRYDAELSADFEGDGRFVVPKPVQEAELDRVLRSVAAHASA